MAQALPTLNLIGAGRVGQTLAHLWTRHGVLWVQDVLTRSPDSARTALDFIAPDASTGPRGGAPRQTCAPQTSGYSPCPMRR